MSSSSGPTVPRYVPLNRELRVEPAVRRRIEAALVHPPKVVWIRRGNCSTEEIATVLRGHHADLLALGLDVEGSSLAIG
jgi:hypothetical protein